MDKSPFRGNKMTPLEEQFNISLNKVRGALEWMFDQRATFILIWNYGKHD